MRRLLLALLLARRSARAPRQDPHPQTPQPQHRAGISRYRQTGHGPYIDSNELLHLLALRKTGEGIRIEMSFSRISLVRDGLKGGEPLVLAIIRDAIERRRMQEEIRRPNEDLENRIAEHAQQSEATLAERKRTEEALRQSEERFRSLVQYASDITLLASTS